MTEFREKGCHLIENAQPWLAVKDRIGYIGEIRALEATVGANGWHPHLHVLLFTSRALNVAELDDLRAYYLCRWSRSVVRFGYREPTAEHGVTIVESHRDDYLAKMGLADELANGAIKEARSGSRTPLQVLADFADTGDAPDLDSWREWVLAMHGARQLTWSRGLRRRYAKEPEKTDAEIVVESGGDEEQVAVISPETWREAILADSDVMWRLLDAAETGGQAAVEEVLRQALSASGPA